MVALSCDSVPFPQKERRNPIETPASAQEGDSIMFKVKVIIDGRTYTLSAEEQDGYIEKVAEYVDSQVQQIKSALHTSSVDSATMAAMNIADSYFREKEASRNLQRQLKEALDERGQLNREISDLKMQVFSLSQGKKK
jgi:cell division protein ZapA